MQERPDNIQEHVTVLDIFLGANALTLILMVMTNQIAAIYTMVVILVAGGTWMTNLGHRHPLWNPLKYGIPSLSLIVAWWLFLA